MFLRIICAGRHSGKGGAHGIDFLAGVFFGPVDDGCHAVCQYHVGRDGADAARSGVVVPLPFVDRDVVTGKAVAEVRDEHLREASCLVGQDGEVRGEAGGKVCAGGGSVDKNFVCLFVDFVKVVGFEVCFYCFGVGQYDVCGVFAGGFPDGGVADLLEPVRNGFFAFVCCDAGFEGAQIHVSVLGAVEVHHGRLVVVPVGGANEFAAEAAFGYGGKGAGGGGDFYFFAGVEFAEPIGFPQVGDGFCFCEPAGTVAHGRMDENRAAFQFHEDEVVAVFGRHDDARQIKQGKSPLLPLDLFGKQLQDGIGRTKFYAKPLRRLGQFALGPFAPPFATLAAFRGRECVAAAFSALRHPAVTHGWFTVVVAAFAGAVVVRYVFVDAGFGRFRAFSRPGRAKLEPRQFRQIEGLRALIFLIIHILFVSVVVSLPSKPRECNIFLHSRG